MRGERPGLRHLGLHPGDIWEFVIRGEYMPSFTNGESVRVRRRRIYAPGDVVVVRRNDYWDTHCFLGYALTSRGIVALTQADNASHADAASVTAAMVGRVQCEVTLADRCRALGRYAKAAIERVVGGRR